MKDEQRIALWAAAEKRLTSSLNPEDLRTSGLLQAERQQWSSALLRLEEAVYHGVRDFQTLDALGEAAYKAKAPQALVAYTALYRDPLLATHMARALLMCNRIPEAEQFAALARESLLKKAIVAVIGFRGDIDSAIELMLAPLQDPEIKHLNFVEYWQGLAEISATAGRSDVVQFAERRLKALAYDRPVPHFNQSLRLLAEGELRAGWLLYDWRLCPGSATLSETKCAELNLWEGEELQGKKLLVIPEYGGGDQLFSLRFVRELLDRGNQVELAVSEQMMDLVKYSFPQVFVHSNKEIDLPDYWTKRYAFPLPDYWCFSLSLPARADISEVVGWNGYLKAPEKLVKQMQLTLNHLNPSALPVRGIVWHGDVRSKPMRTRAYTVEEFLQESKILDSPCLLVCLQKDVTTEELQFLQQQTEKAGGRFFDASSSLKDFAVTAAWMSGLDRMWSCDTSTAHLAGALNVPCTVLIRNKSVWQWKALADSKSFWYESIHLQDALVPKYSYFYNLRED
jgi:hypothetical protein